MIKLASYYDDGKWLFPAALFGGFRDCRKHWQELLKRAWQANSWKEVLTNELMRDIRADEADIVYEIGRGPIDLQMQTPQWWASYAGDLRPTKSRSIAVIERDQALLQEGLEYLWYVVAHLGKHVTLPYLHYSERYIENRNAILETVADAVVRWLPEIVELSPRLAQGADPSRWRIAGLCPSWVIAIRQSLGMGNYRIGTWSDDPDSWLELSDQHRGDPIKFLELLDVITPSEGRYCLGESVMKK